MSKQPVFSQDQMSYYEFLRRYKFSTFPTRIRFKDFPAILGALAEGEFLLASLSDQDERRTPAYRKLCRVQARLRARLVITATPVEEFWPESGTEGPVETEVEPEVTEEEPPIKPRLTNLYGDEPKGGEEGMLA